jgi:hypothetical protein
LNVSLILKWILVTLLWERELALVWSSGERLCDGDTFLGSITVESF